MKNSFQKWSVISQLFKENRFLYKLGGDAEIPEPILPTGEEYVEPEEGEDLLAYLSGEGQPEEEMKERAKEVAAKQIETAVSAAEESKKEGIMIEFGTPIVQRMEDPFDNMVLITLESQLGRQIKQEEFDTNKANLNSQLDRFLNEKQKERMAKKVAKLDPRELKFFTEELLYILEKAQSKEDEKKGKKDMLALLKALNNDLLGKFTPMDLLALDLLEQKTERSVRLTEWIDNRKTLQTALRKISTPKQRQEIFKRMDEYDLREWAALTRELLNAIGSFQETGRKKGGQREIASLLEKDNAYFDALGSVTVDLWRAEFEVEQLFYEAEACAKEAREDQDRLVEAIREDDGSPEDKEYIASRKSIASDSAERAALAQIEVSPAEAKLLLATTQYENVREGGATALMAGGLEEGKIAGEIE